GDHEAHSLPAVGEIRPDEAHDIREGRRAAHERDRQIDGHRRGGTAEVLLDEHGRRAALDQTERQSDERPRQDLPPEHGLRNGSGLQHAAHVPVSMIRLSRKVMISTPISVQAPPMRIRAESRSSSSRTLSTTANTGESVVTGATLVTG